MGPGRSLHSAVGKVEMGRPLAYCRVFQCVCAGSDGGKVSSKLSAQTVGCRSARVTRRQACLGQHRCARNTYQSFHVPVRIQLRRRPQWTASCKMFLCMVTLLHERGITLPEVATMLVHEEQTTHVRVNYARDATSDKPYRSTVY